MPELLDLEAIRGHVRDAMADGTEDMLYQCVHDAEDMIAEIERLRAIAAPLERLEAWRQLDMNLHEFEADIASGNPPQCRVTLSVCGHALTWIAPTLSAAIAGALDYKEASPHA